MLLLSFNLGAQEIRYVSKSGAYANDGKSWANAKINIQDAINDLVDNGLTGEVWVAAGTYNPTESTESNGGSTLYLSIKISEGIKVYGGFAGNENTKEERAKINDANIGWFYTNRTIISGDLVAEAKFTWNNAKKQYDTSFYGNCYHVVWFATNGFDENGRANPLNKQALLEGCIVMNGNARNSVLTGRPHNAYGGGIYMVEGANVENCYIKQCEASRDGGGVYMDGGGNMNHCYVADCQAVGVVIENGFGGGVCLDANKSKNAFGINRSGIANCVARYGGGLAINVPNLKADDGTDIKYKPYASAVLVTNNTATSEAGGVYMNRGGAITQMTIVRNQCNGLGITSNGVTNGRAAGLYCRDNGYILNSVMWGGECEANNNIQYATSRSSNDESLKVEMQYSTLSKSDFVDWSGTKKLKVLSMSAYNDNASETAAGENSNALVDYPMFKKPTPSAGHLENGAYDILHTYHWQMKFKSLLINNGLLTVEIDREGILPFSQEAIDIAGNRFNSRSTLGSYAAININITPQTEGSNVNLYVDDNTDKGMKATTLGASWDTPLRFLANALHYVKENATSLEGKTVNIYVKEGTQNNTNSFNNGRIRMLSIDIPSNVNIYGGYPDELTGTNLKQTIGGTLYQRNPLRYPTIISARITSEYDVNAAHLVTFNGSQDVVFDGFQVRFANATSTLLTNNNTNGAGMTFSNGAKVSVRNVLIADCTAEKGAAIFATDNSQVELVNCIIHNNTSSNLNGIIYSENGAQLSFDHCDFLRNVGYVGYLDGTTTKQTFTNSIFFGNMKKASANNYKEEGGGVAHCLPSFAGNTANATGSYCMFDKESEQFNTQFGGKTLGPWQYDLQYNFKGGDGAGYPRFINPTKTTGASPTGDATFNGRATSFEPHNNNPIVNVAYSVGDHTAWGTDISTVTTRDYGGQPDIGAVENHASTKAAEGENAYVDGQTKYGAITYVRDYNTYSYDSNGNATLVTEDLSTENRDGTSWSRAINGNATYDNNTQFVQYNLVSPVASTIASPKPYKIGMLSGNKLGNPVYYARNATGIYLANTTTVQEGDDFILIASDSFYYIYDLTKSMYVCYVDTKEGSKKVYLSASNATNALWRLFVSSNASNMRTYIIQPKTTWPWAPSVGWNYYDGTNGTLGLYRGTSYNSKWQFYEKTVLTVTDDTNGLQYAVNNAEKLMSASYTSRTTKQSEKYDGGTASTTHTYYDFTPTDANPQREVWVGAGIYTNTKGYQIRNHVKVYGAFPKKGNPGKEQRHPQLTNGVSQSADNAGITIQDYETILQTNNSIAQRNNHKYDLSVLSHPAECRVTESDQSNVPQNRTIYEGAEWDGFTLRYGYKSSLPDGGVGRRNGGAGLQLYENVTVTNCVIRDNLTADGTGSGAARGAGAYVDGAKLINCYIMNNIDECTGIDHYGGGLYMIKGTIYNSVIAGNKMIYGGQGAGAFFESADFYNNTVVNNSGAGALGVWTASGADAHLTVYNSIIMGGTNMLINRGNTTPISFKHSFLQSTQNAPTDTNFKTDTRTQTYCGSAYNAETYNPFAKPYAEAIANYDYRLVQKDTYNAVNAGTQFIDINNDGVSDITLPDYDMDYAERVQDCELDMGAFEYNGAYSILPDLTSVAGEAIYYVTPKGHGNASASSPTNAACADKLQKVLDAAGRYKYNNPSVRVIVKVANDNALAGSGSKFKYYATRTTYEGEQDVRVWSIIVPRGIEVWGGYTDTYTSPTDNGFYLNNGTYTDRRDITANPTYFDSYYFNKSQKVGAYTYHVVTFTDRVFDGDGLPYKEGDVIGGKSSFTNYIGKFMSMASKTNARAVVDGIFITGGNANLQITTSGTTAKDINQYGGGAIVTDYAHVRNCILQGNKGIYGGALALTHNALVSGCLIDKNTADYGGALYVIEDGIELSDGTIVNSAQQSAATLDANMAHVYTSTIVNNKANTQGGGIWFGQTTSNVRVNSCIIWQNDSQDQANVSGLSNPEKPAGETSSATEFYPFSYCASQNVRLTGTNNRNLKNLNREGVRFAKQGSVDKVTLAVERSATGFDKFSDFGYYGLTNYSILVKTGMPITDYNTLKGQGLAEADFTKTDRLVGISRSFIDIGARAINKVINTDKIMLRLYVTQPDEIDMNVAEDMMKINTVEGTPGYDADVAYYAQEGSSFAYPMQSLQDALDYIYLQRTIQPGGNLFSEDANNLPFEICVSKGTYYPTRDISGNYGFAVENTFLIPEGVSIIGGFSGRRAVKEDGTDGGPNNFYGRYYTKGFIKPVIPGEDYDIYKNTALVSSNAVTINGSHGTYIMRQLPMVTMERHRQHSDINANNIIEPWEFTNQTVLKGNVRNVSNKGVHHVVTIFADQTLLGALPIRYKDNSANYKSEGDPLYGYTSHEVGQPVTLDGLTISDGFAHDYNEGSIKDNNKFFYYHGGGLIIDGDLYCNDFNNKTSEGSVYKHTNVANAVAYRDIPLIINRCKFENNRAGYGAAISANTSIDVFSSTFEHNIAEYGRDENVSYDGKSYTITYPGHGGAIYSTHNLSAFNTIFANNEALDPELDMNPRSFLSLRTQTSGSSGITPPVALTGCGGAIYVGKKGTFHLVNCNFVHNMANAYPAIFTMNPNNYPAGAENYKAADYSQIANSVFWANEVNSGMKAKWGSNEYFNFASQLICNYGDRNRSGNYNPTFVAGNVPSNQAELDANYQETAWFCAYETGRGITQDNKHDLREIEISPLSHFIPQLTKANDNVYQNCNIIIASDNELLDGPNFVNPSQTAGYAGYSESADWSISRLNRLTDNGSGKISQTISLIGETYSATFDKYASDAEVPAEKRAYSEETAGDYKTAGIYSSARYYKGRSRYHRYLPIGTDEYMKSAYVLHDGTQQQLYRISYDPNPTHNQTYVDIGIYEYPHTQLQYTTVGDEVDVLWVSPIEKPDNGLPDGSAWSQPTSDLQRAIETLLSSRNGHRKEIRLLDGTYTPIYNIENRYAFTIDTRAMNESIELPKVGDQLIEGLDVKSLTIKGGYSKDLDNVYDVKEYPAIIRQQNRVDEDSDQYDYLFYIKDATQRYGLHSYSSESGINGFGWWPTSELQTSKEVRTIPVEIDGVSIINNQALHNTEGAAIHYADPKFDGDFNLTNSDSPTYEAIATTPANISNIVYYKDDTMLEVSDVPTPYFKRDGTKYYTDATYKTESATETQYVKYGHTEKTNPAKLIISKTTVMNSGTHYAGGAQNDYSSSSVFIGKNGGYALLYNNVMHSNYGDPLKAECQTVAINNTFARNYGKVNITGGDTTNKSQIFNSVFWRNNPTGTDTYGPQFSLTNYTNEATSGEIFKRNAFTGGNTDYTDYVSGPVVDNNFNVGLSLDNTDVINGPNFVDPDNKDVEKRNFNINPSLRLLNKGDNSLYNYNLTKAYNVYDIAWLTTTRNDVASNARFVYDIDIGAFEYENNLERVIYVNPNSAVTGTGSSWSNPVGYGNLQTAVDLAAIYHVNNPTEEAYVFVKGASLTNAGLHTGETLTLRDGVTVYGSISPTINVDCEKTVDSNGVTTFSESQLSTYIKQILSTRDGVASSIGNKTTVSAIKVSPYSTFNNTNGNIVSLVDGFDVTSTTKDNTQGTATSSVIDIRHATDNARIAIRNIIVHNNNLTATPGANVAEINNALIYEALFRDNKVADDASVLRLGANGYAVNITAEGKTTGADDTTPYNGSDAAHIYASIVNYAGENATEQTLSGYSYKVSDANLNYQLTEKSKHIDECPTDNPIATVANLSGFINYATDRDLLGNPRLLDGVTTEKKIDRGAFETWRINQPVVTTTATNGFYPHDGSVVYIMDGHTLVSGHSLTPSYLLLQKGTSLYGEGHAVNVAYLGVEREVKKGGAIVSMPYKMNYATNVAVPTYSTDGILSLDKNGTKAYLYNGLQRAAWNYEFMKSASACWNEVTAEVDASRGVLYESATNALYRFTGKGTTMKDYIYTEAENGKYKNVTLNQHDDRLSTNGGADFTSQEDMGWNCFGLPYLVNTYKPYAQETFTGNSHYNMDIPHKLWLYYDGQFHADGSTKAEGDGGYAQVSSWDSTDWHLPTGETAHIWIGEGIFTQTAAVSDTEELTFYRPVYSTSGGAKSMHKVGTRFYIGNGIEDNVTPQLNIYARGHMVYVTGLQGDESITIYDSTGRIYNMAKATDTKYSTALPTAGVYIVKVNANTKKVLIK